MKTIFNFILLFMVTSCAISCLIPDVSSDDCVFDNLGTVEINSQKFQSYSAEFSSEDFGFDLDQNVFSFSMEGRVDQTCNSETVMILFSGFYKKSEPIDNTYIINSEYDIETTDVIISYDENIKIITSGEVTIKKLSEDEFKININGSTDKGESFSININSKFSI